MQSHVRSGLSGRSRRKRRSSRLIATLLESGTEPKPMGSRAKNVPMLRQFVQMAHDKQLKTRCRLAEVSQMMHVGKSTLSAACKDTYGMSVVALMRKVRLEQCRMALIKPEAATTVRSVMTKYRFTNQNRFAKTYKDAFGELPSETYMRGQGPVKTAGTVKSKADSSGIF